MVFRRAITRGISNDQLRDYYLRLLDSGEPLGQDREKMMRAIARFWRSDADPKRDRRIARYEKALAIVRQIAELRRCRGMTVVQARQTLARQHGHNSGTALYKWLQRNRRLPDLVI
jgi:hypothetical protein